MSLFNEYKNKNITFLTRYINSYLNETTDFVDSYFDKEHDGFGLSSKEMHDILVGIDDKEPLTYPDLVSELSNSKELPYQNAGILYDDVEQDVLVPLNKHPLPIRATLAERAWLYYYLKQPEAKLFLSQPEIDTLLKELRFFGIENNYPLNDSTFTVRELNRNAAPKSYSDEEIDRFRTILQAISNHQFIKTNNHARGTDYTEQILLPFRFEYSNQTGSLYVSAYNTEENRSIMLNLKSMYNTELSGCPLNDKEYKPLLEKYNAALDSVYVSKPVTIRITDHHNGFDRAVFTLANFKRVSYREAASENPDGKESIIMQIYYRRFQRTSLINKLLFLGTAVTILDPPDIIQEYVSRVKDALENYNNV